MVDPTQAKNVVLISLDCVKTEALSCYPESFDFLDRVPYSANTPNIDQIATDGTVFRQAFCQAPFTPASHASVFTGLNPYNHGIRNIFGRKLRDDVLTLAEKVSNAGIKTGGFVGAHALSSDYGLARGFDEYDEEFQQSKENWVLGNRRSGDEVAGNTLDWLQDQSEDDRFLAFLHFFDAHDAVSAYYNESEKGNVSESDDHEIVILRRLYQRFVRPFDHAMGRPIARGWETQLRLRKKLPYGIRYQLRKVATIDNQVGRIIDELKDRGEYDETLFILFADHGDAFGEHGEFSHREYLYDTTLHVPLIVKSPESTDDRVCTDLVRLIDVYPTVLSSLGISTEECDGKPLSTAITDDIDRYAYAETRYERSAEDFTDLEKSYVALRSRRWKLIVDRLSDKWELYDIKRDPDEQINRYNDNPDAARLLETRLEELLVESSEDSSVMTESELDSVQDRLEGLGYL